MKPVTRITGRAAAYMVTNVDTDQIVPGRFMSRSRAQGYGDALFHDLRFDATGAERAEFTLNQPSFRSPRILIAGDNFACGSSRECAAWAVLDAGIECVISSSFSDIFKANAVENGLLAVVVDRDLLERLQQQVTAAAPCSMTVDLSVQTITGPTGESWRFEFDPGARKLLLGGLTKIDSTLQHRAAIDRFEQDYCARFPWAAPGGN